jgi:hypothetical protein
MSMPCEVFKRWLEENSDVGCGESVLAEGTTFPASSPLEPGVGASTMDVDVAMNDLVSIF